MYVGEGEGGVSMGEGEGEVSEGGEGESGMTGGVSLGSYC